ncbi:DNA segregation ATPase FtsK/SpoIIIE and related proteins [Escherichia coli]|uniref:DNA segregation ATPase FtsK/SpoIIIE and related proteins n=1 Tax=Escherichia coli TaxID=562 RepID=A0A376TLS8_ECOLX|nr:DNA segregation ATPase FtsK/SpoIIIE and related proteins [Escherichia coli]
MCNKTRLKKARIRMIDPKAGIDFPLVAQYARTSMVTLLLSGMKQSGVLEELVAEMERRNRLLAEAGVTKLDNYNSRVPTSEQTSTYLAVS